MKFQPGDEVNWTHDAPSAVWVVERLYRDNIYVISCSRYQGILAYSHDLERVRPRSPFDQLVADYIQSELSNV